MPNGRNGLVADTHPLQISGHRRRKRMVARGVRLSAHATEHRDLALPHDRNTSGATAFADGDAIVAGAVAVKPDPCVAARNSGPAAYHW